MASSWQTARGPLSLEGPLFLGILNVTPDSFSDGGRHLGPGAALAQARVLLGEGARILDVGAESTRPHAAPVSPEEEWARLEPVLKLLAEECPEVPLSLDTRHVEVAARGLAAGVAVLNDVTGFQDPAMLRLAQESSCGLVAMRSRSDASGLLMPPYLGPGRTDPGEALAELAQVRDRVLGAGIPAERVLLDPGFGFGTTLGEDLALWGALPGLPHALGWPAERFCLGISRKRFLACRAGAPSLPPLERDPLTARAHREAFRQGYRVFRTHRTGLPSIRLATLEDAGALAAVQLGSWRSAYRGLLPESFLAGLSLEALTDPFLSHLRSPRSQQRSVHVLEAMGKVQGYAISGPGEEARRPGPTAEIQAFCLREDVWRLGLGRALMERVLADLGARGFREAVLWVLERNEAAQGFYEATGWQPCLARRTLFQDGFALEERKYRHTLGAPGGR